MIKRGSIVRYAVGALWEVLSVGRIVWDHQAELKLLAGTYHSSRITVDESCLKGCNEMEALV